MNKLFAGITKEKDENEMIEIGKYCNAKYFN
jgi:hypothetical protein